MVDPSITSALFGAAGGAFRGVFGFFQAVKKDPEIKWDSRKYGQSILRGGLVGFIGGLTVAKDPVTSFLTGFTGDVVLHDLGLKV